MRLQASRGLAVILSEAKDLELVNVSVRARFFALLRMTREKAIVMRSTVGPIELVCL